MRDRCKNNISMSYIKMEWLERNRYNEDHVTTEHEKFDYIKLNSFGSREDLYNMHSAAGNVFMDGFEYLGKCMERARLRFPEYEFDFRTYSAKMQLEFIIEMAYSIEIANELLAENIMTSSYEPNLVRILLGKLEGNELLHVIDRYNELVNCYETTGDQCTQNLVYNHIWD